MGKKFHFLIAQHNNYTNQSRLNDTHFKDEEKTITKSEWKKNIHNQITQLL